MNRLAATSATVLLALVCEARPARADLPSIGITDLSLTRVLDGLFAPTAARYLPDGRLVIIQQSGEILVYTGTLPLIAAGTLPVEFSGEQGLLGLAVDPQFTTSNRLYFYYSASGSAVENRHRVAYATINPMTSIVNVAGRTTIVSGLYGPANHNGGGIEFGPDGLLYIGVGDTGCNCGCAPGSNTNNYFPTCLTNASGKILRVDRDGNIPPANPLVGLANVTACGADVDCSSSTGQPQTANAMVTGAPRLDIYNWGFRNPWRFSFDSQSGFLWIGDVGEVTYEEITISSGPGQHHGWPYREGVHGQAVATCQTITPNAVGPCVEPVYEYAHGGSSASVTGGVFSNHCSWPAPYFGAYWFGDYNVGRIWTLQPNMSRDGIDGGRTERIRQVTGVVHFFLGNDNAVYYVTIDDGEIWRIAPATPATCGSPDAGPPDSGEPPDSGVPPDSGMVPPPPDSGPPPPPPDSGVVAMDAGGDKDAAVVEDTGVVDRDAGAVEDTGVVVEDTGVVVEDTGSVAEDATPAMDAAVFPDSGSARDATAGTLDAIGSAGDASGGTGGTSGGCGCSTADAGSRAESALLMMCVLAMWIARRRR